MVERNNASIPMQDHAQTQAALAIKLASEAGQAYMDGNMNEAARLYKQAGDAMSSVVVDAETGAQRDFVRIIALASYFKGGHFKEALQLCRRVKQSRIKRELQVVHGRFSRELQERTRKDYRQRIATRVNDLSRAGKYEKCLQLLDDHPWALPAEETLRLRISFANLAGMLDLSDVLGTDAASAVASVPEEEAVQAVGTDALLPMEPDNDGDTEVQAAAGA